MAGERSVVRPRFSHVYTNLSELPHESRFRGHFSESIIEIVVATSGGASPRNAAGEFLSHRVKVLHLSSALSTWPASVSFLAALYDESALRLVRRARLVRFSRARVFLSSRRIPGIRTRAPPRLLCRSKKKKKKIAELFPRHSFILSMAAGLACTNHALRSLAPHLVSSRSRGHG